MEILQFLDDSHVWMSETINKTSKTKVTEYCSRFVLTVFEAGSILQTCYTQSTHIWQLHNNLRLHVYNWLSWLQYVLYCIEIILLHRNMQHIDMTSSPLNQAHTLSKILLCNTSCPSVRHWERSALLLFLTTANKELCCVQRGVQLCKCCLCRQHLNLWGRVVHRLIIITSTAWLQTWVTVGDSTH